MQLPYSIPSTFSLLRLAKDEEELIALLRTRPIAQLVLFFTSMAQDETWCSSHVESVKCVIQRLVDSFLARQLSLQQAREVAEQIRQHSSSLLQFLPRDLDCLVEGQVCSINSLLLGVESAIIRAWLWEQPKVEEGVSPPQKRLALRFALGMMSKRTFHALEEQLTEGRSDSLLLFSLQQLQSALLDSVRWELESFRAACIEVLSLKLHPEDLSPFLALAMQRSLEDLKQLCCVVWNRSGSGSESGVELQTASPGELGLIVHAFHLSEWPLLVRDAEWVTRLTFCGNSASHSRAKELAALCKRVVSFDLTHTESCDDALLEYFFSAEELYLASCPWLDNRHVEQLFSHITKLKALDLSNNPQITKQPWNNLKYYEGLKKLRLTYYHVAQEKELPLILLLLASKATEIDISWSSGVKDSVIEIFTKQSAVVNALYLSHCENITDATLSICQERLHNLHTLDLSGDVQLSEHAIETLVLTMPSLRLLDVRKRPMSAITLSHLRNKRPDVTILV